MVIKKLFNKLESLFYCANLYLNNILLRKKQFIHKNILYSKMIKKIKIFLIAYFF